MDTVKCHVGDLTTCTGCSVGYHFQASDIDEEEVVDTYHRIMEAFKFVYAKRSALGDEDYWDVEDVSLERETVLIVMYDK